MAGHRSLTHTDLEVENQNLRSEVEVLKGIVSVMREDLNVKV